MTTNQPMNQSQFNKARSDKFIMVLDIPEALRAIDTREARANNLVDSKSITYSVFASQIPDVQVHDTEQKFSGQAFHFTSHHRPEYGNVTVKFTIDNQFKNYWVVYKWINILNNNKEGFFDAENLSIAESPFETYSTTATLFGLDEFDQKKIQFDFIGVVPVKLGGINYDYRTEDEIETYLEFSFSQMLAKLV